MDTIRARFHIKRPGFTLDVNLSVPGRGVTALFGHSGSGKTTLLRCIAGLERAPDGFLAVHGEIWQDGTLWLPPHKRPLGYVFQEVGLFPHLSVLDNVQYGMKRTPTAGPARLNPVVELLGIGHLLHRKPDRLSGGERQRVGIARALAVNPRILLMDEPMAALDPGRKQEILPYLERVSGELDIPIVYVSHSPDEVARLADHLVAMEDGKVLLNGPLVDSLAQIDLPIRLGEEVGAVLEATVGSIDHAWHLARVDFTGGSLWTRNPGIAVGSRVRVRVLARDVSLAVDPPGTSSIQNVMAGCVDALADDEHPGLTLVRVRVGGSYLLARLTRRSASELNIHPGQVVWVQVKSVALLE